MTTSERIFRPTEFRRRFRRRHRDSIVTGVCAAVADYFSLDRTVVRLVALLLLWFFTIPTLLLYGLLTCLVEIR
jgi:phage shock protein PspC (stress-responsive transcriptional regulator)